LEAVRGSSSGPAIAIGLALALAASPAFAETEAEVASLVGLQGVRVVIENIPETVRKVGLRRERMQTDVEQRLRSRGIQVAPESSTPDGSPSLHVRLRLLRAEGGLLYSISLMLFQRVALVGSSLEAMPAITWEAEAIGYSARSSRFDVQNALLGVASSFANDFLAANPRE
jgi:hypothetical protein